MSDIFIAPGETGSWGVTVTNAAGGAQSLSALSEAWWTVKNAYSVADPGTIQLTKSGGAITVTNAAAGTMTVVAPSANTAALEQGRTYFWDMRLKFADGTISNPTGLAGSLKTNTSVTRATS